MSGAAAVLDERVAIKRRKRGLQAVASWWRGCSAVGGGGERCDDLAALREDAALALLLGHGLPAPQTARDFLEAFDEAAPPLWQGALSQVPGEGERCRPGEASRRLIGFLQERRPQAVATIDVDATILESQKRRALDLRRPDRLPAGGGALGRAGRGAGRRVRDGNVPAGTGNRRGGRAGAGGAAGGGRGGCGCAATARSTSRRCCAGWTRRASATRSAPT